MVALDGNCGASNGVVPRAGAAPGIMPVADSMPVGAPVGSSSLQWGAPGFTQGWTPQQREQYLANHHAANPDVSYWTPFWKPGPPNDYTGTPDTGARNTYATIHDFNIAHRDWPWIADYFDIVTPLTGRTHEDIDNSVVRFGHNCTTSSACPSRPRAHMKFGVCSIDKRHSPARR